jgi:hypothetical protein
MSVPKDRSQPGPGAPLTAEREQYRRLMAQGLNNHQACLLVGVNPTTGMRWSKGRNMVDHTGKAPLLPADPRRAEGDLTAVSVGGGADPDGDLLAVGHSQRVRRRRTGPKPVDGQPGNPTQHQRRRELPAVRRAPQSPRPTAPAQIGQTGPRQRLARLRCELPNYLASSDDAKWHLVRTNVRLY